MQQAMIYMAWSIHTLQLLMATRYGRMMTNAIIRSSFLSKLFVTPLATYLVFLNLLGPKVLFLILQKARAG